MAQLLLKAAYSRVRDILPTCAIACFHTNPRRAQSIVAHSLLELAQVRKIL